MDQRLTRRCPVVALLVVSTLGFGLREACGQFERLGQKIPEPDKAAQDRAESLIKRTFQNEYARRQPREIRDFALKLFLQGLETTDDPAAKFVLYREASLLAARVGEIDGAWFVMDQVQREFDVPIARLMREVLRAATEGSIAGSTQKLISQAALIAADRAITADDLTTSADLLALADAASEKANATALKSEVKSRRRELDEVRQWLEEYRSARAKLKAAPNDPYGNLEVAKYLCCVKGEWSQGLPVFARAAADDLKDLAAKEMALPADATAQAELASAWWDQGQKRTGIYRRRILTRACSWYNLALTRLAGLTLTVAKDRVAATIKEFPELALAGDVSTFAAYAGLWEISYTNGAKRFYVIDLRGTVYQVTEKTTEYGRLIPKDRKFNLRLIGTGSKAVEDIELKNGELQIEHYNPPGRLDCVGVGKQHTLPELRSGVTSFADDFGPFSGIWFVRYTNRAMRMYVIGPKGSAVGLANSVPMEGRLRKRGNDVLLDVEADKVERVKIQEGVLRIEHFNPASSYPSSPAAVLGGGTFFSRL